MLSNVKNVFNSSSHIISLDHNGTFEAYCIGEYSGVTNTLQLEKCHQLVFARNRPPRDRTIRRIEQSRIPYTIFLAVVVVACIGILLALTFLAINIRFRNER